MRFTSIIFVLLLSGLASANSLDQQVLKTFVDTQKLLQQRLMSFCENTTQVPIKEWQSTATLWFEVEGLQLPAAEFMQTKFAYVFWPDPKDRLRNQLTSAISKPVVDVDWKTLPASVVSLSAIEYLLVQEQPRQHCDWMLAISNNQVIQAEQLYKLQRFYSFDTPEQLTALHGSAMILHSHLKEVLSRAGKTMWVLAPGWRTDSGPTINNALQQQLIHLLMLFSDQHPDIDPWLKNLQTVKPLTINSSRADIEKCYEATEALAKFVENTLAPDLNIYMGFNNFDGD